MKEKIEELFKSNKKSSIEQAMMLIESIHEEHPEVWEIFSGQDGVLQCPTWLTVMKPFVELWLLGYNAKLARKKVERIYCPKKLSNLPLSLPYITTAAEISLSVTTLDTELLNLILANTQLSKLTLSMDNFDISQEEKK